MPFSFNLFKFDHRHKTRLEDLQMIRADLRRATQSVQVLLGPPPLHKHAPLFATALQVQALVAYVRCFATGRRSALTRAVFTDNPAMESQHDEFKNIRDQHIAHPAGRHEHNELLVAAKSLDSPAKGIGSYNFYLAGFTESDLRRLLKLVRFVDKRAQEEEVALGDELAREIIGPKSTYAKAQRVFGELVHEEQLYPTRRRKSEDLLVQPDPLPGLTQTRERRSAKRAVSRRT